MIRIFCKNLDRYIDIEGGTSLLDIASGLEKELGFRPICARVNNKTEALAYEVYTPKLVEFQSHTQGSGPRVYTRSLCMLLYRAVTTVLPEHASR